MGTVGSSLCFARMYEAVRVRHFPSTFLPSFSSLTYVYHVEKDPVKHHYHHHHHCWYCSSGLNIIFHTSQVLVCSMLIIPEIQIHIDKNVNTLQTMAFQFFYLHYAV